MKKLLYVFTSVLFVLGLSSFVSKKNSEVVPEHKSLLWKIEGNGLKTPSYLFGTMHMIEKEYFYFPKSLEKILKKSELLVMEIANVSQMDAMQHLMLKEGTFFDFFSPEQTDTILHWASDKLKMDEATFRMSFNKMKPFVVVQAATQMNFMGKTESYEYTLERIAKENKIKTAGLETVADQIKIFDDLTKEQQAEMVLSGIREEDKSMETTRKMQGLYKRQRLDSLYMYIRDEGGVLAEEQHTFLDQRNVNWIPQIKKFAEQGTSFIAVGAGHLGGSKGVIRLLEQEGYKVTPVKL